MKILKNVMNVGRYVDPVTKRVEEVKIGTDPKRGTEVYFYMKGRKMVTIGKRVFDTKWDMEII